MKTWNLLLQSQNLRNFYLVLEDFRIRSKPMKILYLLHFALTNLK